MTKDTSVKELEKGLNKPQTEQLDIIQIQHPNPPQMGKIRDVEGTLKDACRLADCVNEWSDGDSWGGSFGNTKYTAERILKEWFSTKLIRRMAIDEDGILQGYCTVDGHWIDEDAMYIELLGVRPSQQKRGFGKSLLLKALETAIKLGKRRLELHTWAGNLRAVPVYKKTGFMWCPKTSVLMENFLPAILGTAFFRPFFSKNNWYNSRILTITQKSDNYEDFGMKIYSYNFRQDNLNSLTVYVDRHAKDISGFSYVVNSKELSVQLIPNIHEIFLGIDSTIAELKIINHFNKPISIKGNLSLFKGIISTSIESIDEVVQAGTEKVISIEVVLDPEVETYFLDQYPWKRTDCRLYANLNINGKEILLSVGWLPKEPFQIIMNEPTIYFGKRTKHSIVPIGFRNMMNRPFNGRIVIEGEGLSKHHEFKIDSLKSGDALETQIRIPKPTKPIATAWKWKIHFFQKKSEGELALHPVVRHVSCFTKPGAVAYINPQKEAIIENDQIRFQFELKEVNQLNTVTVKDVGEFSFQTFGICIGKPFPEESSEFWLLDRPYEVIERDNGVSFKQTLMSKVEKPGLQVIRWIEVDAGKPFISCHYEFTNTSDNSIENVAIRHWSPWRTPDDFVGKYILPLKAGWIISEDPEFNDDFDFPQLASEYDEPWLVKSNGFDFGFGIIWEPEQVSSIRGNPFSGPTIDTKSYTIRSKETINLGYFTLVFGKSISQLTRNIWLREFNTDVVFSRRKKNTIEYCSSVLEVKCGYDLAVPELPNNPLLNLNWVDAISSQIPINIFYHANRETPVEAKIELKSPSWLIPFQKDLKLENKTNKSIQMTVPIIKRIDPKKDQVISFTGSIQLPYTSRPFIGEVIPFKSSGKVTLEKKDNKWHFSNNLLSFQTSPRYGASLFSAKFIGGKELFFSRFPSKDTFVWFKRFVGGFHPFIKIPNTWDWWEFLENVWTDPVLIEKNKWFGLSMKLNSPIDEFRLKDIASTVTYYTRCESPILWGRLSFKNNSGVTTSSDAGFFLFLKPIQELITKRHNQIWTYNKTEKERSLYTIPPNNWVITSFGGNRERILMTSINPKITLNGDYMNANNYTELVCCGNYKLPPGITRTIDVPLIFSNKDITDNVRGIFNQLREVF